MLFPFAVRDREKQWLDSQPKESLDMWTRWSLDKPLTGMDGCISSLLVAVRLGFSFLFGEKEGDKKTEEGALRLEGEASMLSHVPMSTTDDGGGSLLVTCGLRR